MRLRIIYLVLTISLFFIELVIFHDGHKIPFVRNSVGDFLVVIFLFTSIKVVFPNIASFNLAVGIFIFGVVIEILQLLKIPQFFGTEKVWVKLILGSSFEWMDIVAYLFGVGVIYYIDKYFIRDKTTVN